MERPHPALALERRGEIEESVFEAGELEPFQSGQGLVCLRGGPACLQVGNRFRLRDEVLE
jgi:hypothetical protein